jgi:hypothetical protein
MKDRMRSLLDRKFEEIRRQEIDPELIAQSARRVWERLQSSEAGVPQRESGPAAAGASGPLEGCADFQALIPAYIARRLPEARSLLLEDHSRECSACRRAIHRARYGNGGASATDGPLSKPPRGWKLPLAAGLAVAAIVAIIVLAGIEGALPGLWTASGARATVESVNGSLYAISGQTPRPLARGMRLGPGEEIRTSPHSTAEIRLAGGSQVEMGMRADVSVTRGWFRTTIHLIQGSIIVQASRRDSQHLSVATRDCLISDQGTIFAVSEGVKGSRVSVLQGQVRVQAGGQSQTVRAGGQWSVGSSLTTIPIGEQISWSPDASRYAALLGELAGIGRKLQAMPPPPPRFSSQLIKLVPDNTVLYAAIPNLGPMLNQVQILLQGRLTRSVLLNQWWQKQQASGSPQTAEEILNRIRACSSYLGNEIVFAAERGTSGKLRPLVLAQVEKPGFRQFLEQQLTAVNLQNRPSGFRVVGDAASLPSRAANPQQIFILLKNNVMAAASDPDALRNVAALIRTGRSSGFSATDFYSAIQQRYRSGAVWLLAVDLEQISPQTVHKNQVTGVPGRRTGLDNVKYLFAESKEAGRRPENRVTVTFAGGREGLVSWLAGPSPMGTLDFVSPQASFAFSVVLRDPKTLVSELLGAGGQGNSGARQALALFESETGVSIENDLAASLGGEVTVAQDGPLLPTPQWLVALEVLNPERLEVSLQKLVSAFNENLGGVAGTLRLTQEERSGRTYYDLNLVPVARGMGGARGRLPRLHNIHYTFADGYWLLAPSQSQLERAIQNRETGYSLTRSPEFQKQLPEDGNAYFSALFYENLGRKLSPLLENLQASGTAAPGSGAWTAGLAKIAAPVLIGAYGEPDRIMLVSNQSPLGLGVNSILMTAAAALHRPAIKMHDGR